MGRGGQSIGEGQSVGEGGQSPDYDSCRDTGGAERVSNGQQSEPGLCWASGFVPVPEIMVSFFLKKCYIPHQCPKIAILLGCQLSRVENLSSKKMARVKHLQENVSFEFD